MSEQNVVDVAVSDNLPARAEHGTTVDVKLNALSGARQTIVSSFDTHTDEGQLALMDAITNAEPLNEHLDETINLVDFVAQAVEFANEAGEMEEGVRVILIDADGSAYAALSDGVRRSIETFIGVKGDPTTWTAPLPVKAIEKKSRRSFKFITLTIAR